MTLIEDASGVHLRGSGTPTQVPEWLRFGRLEGHPSRGNPSSSQEADDLGVHVPLLGGGGQGDGGAVEGDHVGHDFLDGAESCNEGVGSFCLGGLIREPTVQLPPASMVEISKRRNLTPP